ncbi:MAG TPA: pilus assembly protein PilM, partial [Candidatus Omnitrophota bacterium]|nr:pilus assembly protein PilM [Candidatus Omnitrophota bacterium]
MFKHKIQNIIDTYFSLIRKYIPVGPQETSIGLDIGNYQCKAVEVVRTSKNVKIMNWAVEPVHDRDVLSAVRNLLKKIDSESKNVFTGLAGQGTLIRFIRMPRMPVTQLKDSLLIESDKYFPFPSNEIYIDCQIIDDGQIK